MAVWHEGERVCGKVEDTGFGIEDEQLSRLFERYETFGRGGHKGGTGLGLAFVKRVVSVRSRVNQGTVFELQFPALGAD